VVPPRATEAPLPRGSDVQRELMATLVVHDAPRLVRQLVESPGNSDTHELLAHVVGLPPWLFRLVDLRRPAGVGLINPSLLASQTVRPYVAMLPVVGRAEAERAMAEHAPLQRTPWGFVLPTKSGKIYVGFSGGYALVAWRADLLEPARRLLGPRLAHASQAPLAARVEVDNVFSAYGSQLDSLVRRFVAVTAQGGAGGDPQLAFAMRGVRQMAGFARSVSDLELLCDLDSSGLTLTARVDGKREGAFTGYVRQQRPGPAWGVRFLPRDAVMAFTTSASMPGRDADIDASIEFLADVLPAQKVTPAERLKWRQALERAGNAIGGELAYAVWPARGGGVGMGGAYRLRDPGGARAAVMEVYRELSGPLVGLVLRALSLDLERFGSHVAVHKNVARVAGREVDLVEVSVKWPAGSDAERHIFEALYGPHLVLATAFEGDQALFAVGADWAERLGTMLGVAHGTPAASLADEPAFAEALGYRDQARVSLSFLETRRMAQLVTALMAHARELNESQRQALQLMVRQVGQGAIVSVTNASGARYELTTHVPHSALSGAAQLNGALWRVALSPLVNPPMMPPMPVPPPHIAPSVKP
jgi:hypothetical protein